MRAFDERARQQNIALTHHPRFARRQILQAGILAGLFSASGSAVAEPADAWPSIESVKGDSIVVRDDLGTRLVIKLPARRVAVFNRYTAEFVRAIAGPAALVGVGSDTLRETDYWPNLHAANIGQGQSNPNIEAILALRPDIVLFPRNGDWEKTRAALQPFGIPVAVVTAWDVLKHERNVTLLGHLLGQTARADELNGFYQGIQMALASRTAGQPRPSVYFEEVADYKTVLKGSGWHDMIEAAGGENIFGRLTETSEAAAQGNNQAFDIDPEEILTRRPEVIVKLQPNQYAPHKPAFSDAVLRSIAARPGFDTLPAVKNGQVYHMSYYLAGACSKIVGAIQLATWLRPDAFAAGEGERAMRTWLERFQGVPYPGAYWRALDRMRP